MLGKCKKMLKMQKKIFLLQENAKQMYFDGINMILGLLTKIESLGSKHSKNHDF